MAIATLGGTLVAGNQIFCQLTNNTPQDLVNLSIFNLTAQDQLSFAFERLSELLADNNSASTTSTTPAASSHPLCTGIDIKSSTPGVGMHITVLPNCDLSKVLGDCRRNRLLVTLIQVPDTTTMTTTTTTAPTVIVPSDASNNNIPQDITTTTTTTTTTMPKANPLEAARFYTIG